jgi:dipeptidyl aminopeptidase/acylaminoacyl peptidase
MPSRSLVFRATVIVVLSLGATLSPSAQSARRALTHGDYDAWRSIFTPTLTRDGRFLAYSYMPQDGDGELIVRDIKSGQERREPVGALPPPPLPNPEEVSDEPPAPRSVRILTTSDSRFLVATSFATKAATEQARRERKRPEEMPKGDLLVMNLASNAVLRLPAAKTVQVPTRGGPWLAYLKEGDPPPRASNAADASREGAAPRVEYGTDLVLRDLPQGTERVFPDVLEFAFAKDGKTLLYAVSSKNADDNGVYAVTPGSAAAPTVLIGGKGKYSRLTWSRGDTEAAFTADQTVYRWQRGTPRAAAVVSSTTPGVTAPFVVSERGTLAYSRDGKKLYVPMAPPARAARTPDPAEDRVLADLWHWTDDIIQPMQKVRASQERNRTYRGVYHIDGGKFVQLADTTLRTVNPSDDGTRAFGLDDRQYRRMVDYDGNYNDIYLLDTATGARKMLVKQMRGGGGPGGGGPGGGGGPQWSPDGKFAAFYQDKHWHIIDVGAATTRNATSALGVAVYDEDDDTPDPAGSYGNGGWTSDSKSFLVYDKYDVWQVFADGQPARNLTEGEGRKAKIEFRLQRLDAGDDNEDDVRGIDSTKPLYLRGASEETRASGFFQDSFSGSSAPRRLLWGDKNYRVAARAADADVVVVTASRFDEYPDLHVTDSTFRAPIKASNGGSQVEKFTWGTGELVSFRNTDGVPLKAALYKPANFDPKKKYPMIVYIYEGLSQNVHNFVNPAPSHNINFAYYVSNGYVILTPDIVYTEGQPGQSALKCVIPAVDAVVERGFIDESRVGIQGHSWGGYQIAYMVTQTNRFRAVEAGAPVGNMTSAYSGIRWGSGLPRQFQYEQSQSRIGKPLYDDPLKYVENSPIFHVKRITTPMLLLHNDADDAVPWYQGIEMYLALRRNDKEAYLFSYNGEFHGLRRRHNQKDFALRMQQFFDHFLKGSAKPEWMEKGIPYIEREEEKDRLKKALAPTSSQ